MCNVCAAGIAVGAILMCVAFASGYGYRAFVPHSVTGSVPASQLDLSAGTYLSIPGGPLPANALSRPRERPVPSHESKMNSFVPEL